MEDARLIGQRAPDVHGPPRYLYTVLLLCVVGLMGAMAYVLHKTHQTVLEYASLIDHAATIKLETANAHLWFKRLLGRDVHRTMDPVWKHLDKADSSAEALSESGRHMAPGFQPRNGHQSQVIAQKLRRELANFRLAAEKRWETGTKRLGDEAVERQYRVRGGVAAPAGHCTADGEYQCGTAA